MEYASSNIHKDTKSSSVAFPFVLRNLGRFTYKSHRISTSGNYLKNYGDQSFALNINIRKIQVEAAIPMLLTTYLIKHVSKRRWVSLKSLPELKFYEYIFTKKIFNMSNNQHVIPHKTINCTKYIMFKHNEGLQGNETVEILYKSKLNRRNTAS